MICHVLYAVEQFVETDSRNQLVSQNKGNIQAQAFSRLLQSSFRKEELSSLENACA